MCPHAIQMQMHQIACTRLALLLVPESTALSVIMSEQNIIAPDCLVTGARHAQITAMQSQIVLSLSSTQ